MALAVVVWAVMVCLGLKVVLDYQVKPGLAARAPATWPAASTIRRMQGRPTLLLFAHPHCPCTRATVSELARLEARSHDVFQTFIVFAIPEGCDSAWADTELLRSASTMPGASVVVDRTDAESRRFGAFTSGQTLVYDAGGHLVFAGGITPGRGHAGDNAGSDAVLAIAHSMTPDRSDTPVFGCALDTPRAGTRKGIPSCPR
jgi:hypothetical protein